MTPDGTAYESYDSTVPPLRQHPECIDALLSETRKLCHAMRQLGLWRDRLLVQAVALYELQQQERCGLANCPLCRERREQRGQP